MTVLVLSFAVFCWTASVYAGIQLPIKIHDYNEISRTIELPDGAIGEKQILVDGSFKPQNDGIHERETEEVREAVHCIKSDSGDSSEDCVDVQEAGDQTVQGLDNKDLFGSDVKVDTPPYSWAYPEGSVARKRVKTVIISQRIPSQHQAHSTHGTERNQVTKDLLANILGSLAQLRDPTSVDLSSMPQIEEQISTEEPAKPIEPESKITERQGLTTDLTTPSGEIANTRSSQFEDVTLGQAQLHDDHRSKPSFLRGPIEAIIRWWNGEDTEPQKTPAQPYSVAPAPGAAGNVPYANPVAANPAPSAIPYSPAAATPIASPLQSPVSAPQPYQQAPGYNANTLPQQVPQAVPQAAQPSVPGYPSAPLTQPHFGLMEGIKKLPQPSSTIFPDAFVKIDLSDTLPRVTLVRSLARVPVLSSLRHIAHHVPVQFTV